MNPPTIIKTQSKKIKKQDENYNNIIDENYVVFKPFSHGSYGIIYSCISLRDSTQLAV